VGVCLLSLGALALYFFPPLSPPHTNDGIRVVVQLGRLCVFAREFGSEVKKRNAQTVNVEFQTLKLHPLASGPQSAALAADVRYGGGRLVVPAASTTSTTPVVTAQQEPETAPPQLPLSDSAAATEVRLHIATPAAEEALALSSAEAAGSSSALEVAQPTTVCREESDSNSPTPSPRFHSMPTPVGMLPLYMFHSNAATESPQLTPTHTPALPASCLVDVAIES
jgi:hypothetical protein